MTTLDVSVRKVGVEEELLLVDPGTGELRNVAATVLHVHRSAGDDEPGAGPATGDLEGELLQHMVETHTDPLTDLGEIADQIRSARRTAIDAARRAGVAVAALGIAPLSAAAPRVTRNPRYERIVNEFGDTGLAAGTLGMHVHVDVTDDEEAIRVVDGLRPWLPVLVALAANSPYAAGEDTGYATWRQQVWGRWPAAGQSEPYGSVAEYRRVTEALIATGAALDSGMLYLDARLSVDYPTVEIRVADVCTDVDDALLVVALARALVETLAGAGTSPPVRSDLLRAAHWRAARHGLSGGLLHPTTLLPVPAAEAVGVLVDRVAPALDAAGDRARVDASLARLGTLGGGARRQRQAYERTGSVAGVVADAVARTEEAVR
ncbi:MAG: glutamate--cysteine ligase [Nocardioides sp.]